MSEPDDFGEERADFYQRISSLERRIALMDEHRSEGGMDQLALSVAHMAEDEFAKHHEGGRTQRLAKIQVIVREAMREMLTGERAWNAWHPGAVSPAPK